MLATTKKWMLGKAALMISVGGYGRRMSDMLANVGRTLTQG